MQQCRAVGLQVVEQAEDREITTFADIGAIVY